MTTDPTPAQVAVKPATLAHVIAEMMVAYDEPRPNGDILAAVLAQVLLVPAAPAEQAEPVADDPHRFAVVSADYCRPFLLGAYPTLNNAIKAQCGSPEKWHIFQRHPAPVPAVPDDVAQTVADLRHKADDYSRMLERPGFRPSRNMMEDLRNAARKSVVTIEALAADNARLTDELENGAYAIIATERAEVLSLRRERDRLAQKLARKDAALRKYQDDLCEGFCKEAEWSDADHSHPDMQRDCGGCLAAAALAQPADTNSEETSNGS